jgi:hypothetical protein
MATEARIDPKLFRQVLHDENFEWHRFNDRWTVEVGSEEHRAMERVLNKFRWERPVRFVGYGTRH